jgi:hypothetical protein
LPALSFDPTGAGAVAELALVTNGQGRASAYFVEPMEFPQPVLVEARAGASGIVFTINSPGDLVSHWKFDDASGAVAVDATGGGTDASLVGAPAWDTGMDGAGGIVLDGNGQYAVIPTPVYCDLTRAFARRSVLLWFRVEDQQTAQILFDEGDSANGLALRVSDGQVQAAVRIGGQEKILSAPLPFDGYFHHAAAVFDAGQFRLYFDGVLAASGAAVGQTVERMTIRLPWARLWAKTPLAARARAAS